MSSRRKKTRRRETSKPIFDVFMQDGYEKKSGQLDMKTSIRFKNQALTQLRETLLADLTNEYFAVLMAKQQVVGNLRVLTVMDVAYPDPSSYKNQGGAALKVDFDSFMKGVLIEIDERIDVDTVIDVHTHPFSHDSAWFSSIDDADEGSFAKYLDKYGMYYASIVFTQTNYKARYWEVDDKGHPWHSPALIKTQKPIEQISSPDDSISSEGVGEMFDRSVRALGLESMRAIARAQKISIIGVGGLGSIVAEHLIHMGFSSLNLIDFDKLEVTNMNRIVGATYQDALDGVLKVDAVKSHLIAINPKADIAAMANNIFDDDVEEAIANSDWVIVATDNHASRFHTQELCFRYFVPFITAGVNITVEDNAITDMSGEVILVRMGDKVCLNCLGRVNYNEIAKEMHPDPVVREGLVRKGYVQGKEVHEPAVKTLNTYLATMAVDTLVNQYTERRRDAVILVYEDNQSQSIYEDVESLERRSKTCNICDI